MSVKTVVVEVPLLGKIVGYLEILAQDHHSTVFVPLCDAYRKLGLYDEAISAARKGTEMVPSYTPGYIALARALSESGDTAAAVAAFQQALALEPGYLAALTGLARVHLSRNERNAALTVLRQAQQHAPDDPLVARMVASFPGGFPPAAKEPVPAARVATPAAAAVVPVGEETAEEVELPQETKPPIATATIADIYIRQGFLDKALKVYSDLLQAEPDNAEIRRRWEILRSRIERERGTAASPSGVSPVPVTGSAQPEVAQGKPAGSVVDAYQRWLDAVQRRRAHV